MENSAEWDVCIVGAGPVGLTLACLLAQSGVRVLMLEREAAAYALPRALQFDDEVMRVFQAVGIASDLLECTDLTPGMRFLGEDGGILLDWPRSAEISGMGWSTSYRFHQPDLERLLGTRVRAHPCARLLRSAEVTAITQHRDGVNIAYTDRNTGALHHVAARYLVGCDGARSLIRTCMGAALDDLSFSERWIVVDAILRRPRPDLGDWSLQYCWPDRPATYVRGVGDRRRWEFALRPAENAADMTRPDNLWRLLAPWITPEDAVLERGVCYVFNAVIARFWRSGRLLIAGDAAHQTPPFLGQGMCAGIRDAANLAWKLSCVLRGADAALLATYESERATHVREYVALAVRLGGLINASDPAAAFAGMEREGGQLTMRSIKPRLGAGLAAGKAALAGTLAPQPRLANGALLDDVVGNRFVALMQPGFAAALKRPIRARLAARGVVLIADDTPALQDWLVSLPAQAVVIRPDRYILGAAGNHAEMDQLAGAIPAGQPAYNTSEVLA